MPRGENSENEATRDKNSSWTQARSLNTPDARVYSEWVLLVKDLEYALRRAQLWKKSAKPAAGNEGALEIGMSLFRDAVVSLVACFDDTSPVHLDPAKVYREAPGATEYFQWLKNLRHTWIGHRGGPQRQCVVTIVIDELTGDLHGIGYLQQLWVGPKAEAGADLVRMMEIALIHGRQELKRCESVVKDCVDRMTKRERLRLPVAHTVAPSHKEIHMGRRKFHNIKRKN